LSSFWQERNLISKFLYRSLEAATNFEGDAGRQKDDVSTLSPASVVVLPLLPPLPEPPEEPNAPPSSSSTSNPGRREFARNLLWNFEDIRMLIGSDMPIFGDADHPSISLRLHDAEKPIHILTGLDYWLDNLMCQVPEVLMCYHLDGIVQRYEVVKTEDLPKMDGCKFSPGVVRDVAKNILSFLQSNAAKEGHTYWLFKGKDDEVVKLYDLTSLCDEVS